MAALALWIGWRHGPEAPLLPFACPVHALTGLHCPGCGTMRGVHAALHGRLLEGLGHNVLAAVSVPYVAVCWALEVHRCFTGRVVRLWATPARVVRWLPWIVVAYTVLRNLPWEPFTSLAP